MRPQSEPCAELPRESVAPRTLRLFGFLPRSRANGPGLRAVVWVQGCSLGCPGCFNPRSHPSTGGQEVAVPDLAARIVAGGGEIEGITVSGGEPFQQRRGLLALLQAITPAGLSVIVFTGLTWEEVGRVPEGPRLLAQIDVLIAGRYDKSRRVARGLTGSSNKTWHFLSSRYGPADFQELPAAEMVLSPDGTVAITGIDPPSPVEGRDDRQDKFGTGAEIPETPRGSQRLLQVRALEPTFESGITKEEFSP